VAQILVSRQVRTRMPSSTAGVRSLCATWCGRCIGTVPISAIQPHTIPTGWREIGGNDGNWRDIKTFGQVHCLCVLPGQRTVPIRLHTAEVPGSIPVTPTTKTSGQRGFLPRPPLPSALCPLEPPLAALPTGPHQSRCGGHSELCCRSRCRHSGSPSLGEATLGRPGTACEARYTSSGCDSSRRVALETQAVA